jgi:hypothetical protein
MKKWLLIVIPVLELAGLITWRFVQKKADGSKQTGMRSAMGRGGALPPSNWRQPS